MNMLPESLPPVLDERDRRIVRATQAGLPLVPRPWQAVAERVGASEAEVMERVRRLKARGVIRRIGAVPNHYALGYTANGMTVWDVDDARVDELGRKVGALDFVSHCYRRPRHRPNWPYNLFAMIHARRREEALQQARQIADLLGTACRAHAILFSSRILKKTGLRLGSGEGRGTR